MPRHSRNRQLRKINSIMATVGGTLEIRHNIEGVYFMEMDESYVEMPYVQTTHKEVRKPNYRIRNTKRYKMDKLGNVLRTPKSTYLFGEVYFRTDTRVFFFNKPKPDAHKVEMLDCKTGEDIF
ncbi:hypothetical protein [Bacillus phage Megatron]|uniref:Uncharacterized protein n=4 Tax=Wphvirus megatron TaxID=1987728 RepID=A0A024B360_9CAUD|nr:hypothetical protein FP75_gp029 [Bacillus phage Megatron]YP_009211976.1 hypothetical protein QLX47_gp036 [Bacillus phage Eyuki]YP_009280837.1 hypothetical protein SAGEFAYGE_34 [Bacillus phage SageFayge]ANI24650.1 hypothetical protein SMUDGE_31 [Bacillus phage Smudge]ASR79247.1 hypothetical protein ZAINNY_34 [Bacillus phage Zainny]AHZ10611.1 hypothetical protein [Bacillus phage Megatron]ALA46594.1 hypothetical protein EYUKI_36 [Bacillus phage Eyuki]AMW62954.1 hypothetical protein SAGEFAYGE